VLIKRKGQKKARKEANENLIKVGNTLKILKEIKFSEGNSKG